MPGKVVVGVAAAWAALALASSVPAKATADPLVATNYSRQLVYASPQDPPRYTAWTGIWQMADGSLMTAFDQATGPLTRPAATPDVLATFGLSSLSLIRDFSGLDLREMFLR